MTLARDGFIVAKDGDDEAGFIEDVVMGDSIEIRGAFISKMLAFRVVDFTSDTPVPLQATVNNLVTANFINTSHDRIIPGLRIANYSIAPQSVVARIENGTVEQWLEGLDIGFKVAFLPEQQAFEFSLYDGRQSQAEFCENFRNITDQQYFNKTARSRNVVLVEGQPIDSGMEDAVPIRNIITIGNAQGLSRREAYVRSGRFPQHEFGQQFLQQNQPTISLDVKIIDPIEPFVYRQDYDIGDIVTIVSETYGVTLNRQI